MSLERYFSVLSGSEGGGYLGVGSSSSSSRGSGSGDYLDTSSGSGKKRWRLSRHLVVVVVVEYIARSPARSLSCGQLTVL